MYSHKLYFSFMFNLIKIASVVFHRGDTISYLLRNCDHNTGHENGNLVQDILLRYVKNSCEVSANSQLQFLSKCKESR